MKPIKSISFYICFDVSTTLNLFSHARHIWPKSFFGKKTCPMDLWRRFQRRLAKRRTEVATTSVAINQSSTDMTSKHSTGFLENYRRMIWENFNISGKTLLYKPDAFSDFLRFNGHFGLGHGFTAFSQHPSARHRCCQLLSMSPRNSPWHRLSGSGSGTRRYRATPRSSDGDLTNIEIQNGFV